AREYEGLRFKSDHPKEFAHAKANDYLDYLLKFIVYKPTIRHSKERTLAMAEKYKEKARKLKGIGKSVTKLGHGVEIESFAMIHRLEHRHAVSNGYLSALKKILRGR
ncbi:MAG TPA: hypothetical protein VNX68_07390, partial [Nitrosopumilaceae archaeon]|nr:hypothetical protein [Nitrosopumilaceae archaeon]